MGHDTANTPGQDNNAIIIAQADRRLTLKKAADFARLMGRANAVAHEVSAALNQIIDHHEAMSRNLGVEL